MGGGSAPTPWRVRDARTHHRRHTASDGELVAAGCRASHAYPGARKGGSDGYDSGAGGSSLSGQEAFSDADGPVDGSSDDEMGSGEVVVGLTHAAHVESFHVDTARLLAVQGAALGAELAAGMPARCDVVVRWLPREEVYREVHAPVHCEYTRLLGGHVL